MSEFHKYNILSFIYHWFLDHAYGLLIVCGFFVSTYLLKKQVRSHFCLSNSATHVLSQPAVMADFAFMLLLIGIIGARLLFLVVNFKFYTVYPVRIFQIWEGGLVFYGGFISACLYAIWFAYRHHVHFFSLADTVIPAVALNHAFGRLGCLIVGCCHGKPAPEQIPTWLTVNYPINSPAYQSQLQQHLIDIQDAPLPVYNTQLLEAFAELLLYIFIRKKSRFAGQAFFVWIMGYAGVRFGLEYLRGDFNRGFILASSLSTSQFIALILIATTTLFYIYSDKFARHMMID